MHASRRPPSESPSMLDLGVRLPLYSSTPAIQSINVSGYFEHQRQSAGALRAERLRVQQPHELEQGQSQHGIQAPKPSTTRRISAINTVAQARSPSTATRRATPWPISCSATWSNFDQGTGEYRRPGALYVGVLPGRLQDSSTAVVEYRPALRAAHRRGTRPSAASRSSGSMHTDRVSAQRSSTMRRPRSSSGATPAYPMTAPTATTTTWAFEAAPPGTSEETARQVCAAGGACSTTSTSAAGSTTVR